MAPPPEPLPALVVSPHLDDAVLSAGQFLAGAPGAVVVTMLAGAPDPPVTTPWDLKSGFETSQEAIAARRAEDAAALALLKATPVHLDFLDGQYAPVDSAAMAETLTELVAQHRPAFVVGPLGVHHCDHESVRDAVLAAELDVPLWLYEDLPYRVYTPEAAAAVVETIRRRGYAMELGFIGSGPAASKTLALWCYRSQMRHPEFDNIHSMLVPERFWRVG
jgi:LmbE family N-acetylglucosaminyl deacetylase